MVHTFAFALKRTLCVAQVSLMLFAMPAAFLTTESLAPLVCILGSHPACTQLGHFLRLPKSDDIFVSRTIVSAAQGLVGREIWVSTKSALRVALALRHHQGSDSAAKCLVESDACKSTAFTTSSKYTPHTTSEAADQTLGLSTQQLQQGHAACNQRGNGPDPWPGHARAAARTGSTQ